MIRIKYSIDGLTRIMAVSSIEQYCVNITSANPKYGLEFTNLLYQSGYSVFTGSLENAFIEKVMDECLKTEFFDFTKYNVKCSKKRFHE